MNGFDMVLNDMRSWNRLNFSCVQLALEANEVIWRRSIQLMTGAMTTMEATRMILEKPSALAKSLEMAAIATASRRSPQAIAEAYVRPFRTSTRRNTRRLRRK